jgi:hypothetical protein
MNEEERIRKYLLDELSDEAREEVRERLARDDTYFESVLEAENDLIDAYARGELDPGLRGKVERFLKASSQEHRADFAAQLAHHAKSETAPIRYRRYVRVAIAACAVLAAALGVSLHRISVMQQTPPATSSPQPEGSIYSFFVTPGSLRSSGTRSVSIPEGSHAVEIQLALPEGTRFSRYAAQLETSAGERRWLAEGSAKGDAFVLLLSRDVLPPGSYATVLYGILDGDRRELVDYYYFEIIPSR